jgi:hypothetical protein
VGDSEFKPQGRQKKKKKKYLWGCWGNAGVNSSLKKEGKQQRGLENREAWRNGENQGKAESILR